MHDSTGSTSKREFRSGRRSRLLSYPSSVGINYKIDPSRGDSAVLVQQKCTATADWYSVSTTPTPTPTPTTWQFRELHFQAVEQI